MSKRDFYENQVVLNSLGFTNDLSWPTITPYLAIFTSSPGENQAGTEVANTNGYARFGPITPYFISTFAVAGEQTNITPITMATPTGSGWGNASSVGIITSGTYGSGTLIRLYDFLDTLGNPTTIPIPAGLPPQFAAGQMLVREG